MWSLSLDERFLHFFTKIIVTDIITNNIIVMTTTPPSTAPAIIVPTLEGGPIEVSVGVAVGVAFGEGATDVGNARKILK